MGSMRAREENGLEVLPRNKNLWGPKVKKQLPQLTARESAKGILGELDGTAPECLLNEVWPPWPDSWPSCCWSKATFLAMSSSHTWATHHF